MKKFSGLKLFGILALIMTFLVSAEVISARSFDDDFFGGDSSEKAIKKDKDKNNDKEKDKVKKKDEKKSEEKVKNKDKNEKKIKNKDKNKDKDKDKDKDTKTSSIHPRSIPFESGKRGFNYYRTPAIIKANNGDLLAFAGGRSAREDDSKGTIVLRRSSDKGRTWEKQQEIAGENRKDRIAIPYPILLDNGKIILLYLKSDFVTKHEDRTDRKVLMKTSDDNGKSWSKERDITSQVRKSHWGDWYGLGPGHGFVKQSAPNKGRIIVAARHSEKINGTDQSRSHIIYSDDAGSTWKVGGQMDYRSSEVAVVELTNGDIMMNARGIGSKDKLRITGVSKDGGLSFATPRREDKLPCPQVSAGMLRRGNDIFFSNPRHTDKRTRGTLQRSSDNGKTWKWRKMYNRKGEFSSYSDLVWVKDGIGVLVEWGPSLSSKDKHKEIRFIFVPKEDLGL